MTLEVFVYSLLGRLPTLLVWMTGLVLCALRFSTDGRRCTLVAAGLILFLVVRLVGPFLQAFILNTVLEDQLPFGVRVIFGNLIYSLPHACGFALLIWAAVGSGGRQAVEADSATPSSATPSA